MCGSYEHQLTVAVRDIDNCAGTSTNNIGWGGDLSERASARFAAFCDQLGPSVSWLRFRSAADMRQAMAADSTERFPILANTTVCVNPARAELVAFDEIADWKVRFLCWRRGARIVRRPPTDPPGP